VHAHPVHRGGAFRLGSLLFSRLPAIVPSRGRQTGLEFVGVIEGKANRSTAVAAAQSAGPSAVAMDGDATANAGIQVIPRCDHAHLAWTTNSPVLGVSDGKWRFRASHIADISRQLAGTSRTMADLYASF
jgi:hypothetical protein